MSSPVGGSHAVQLVGEHGLERFVPAGEEHDVVGRDDVAACVLGEQLEIAGRVLDVGVDELGQGADELRGGIEVGVERVEGRRVDELADGVPEGRLEPLDATCQRMCEGLIKGERASSRSACWVLEAMWRVGEDV